MIHDEFIKSAAITNKVINKAVGSAGDIDGNLLDKAFNFGKKKKPGFFKRQSEKIKSGFSNKNVREEAYSTNIKNKVDNPNPDAQYRSASRNFSQENPQSDNFVPGESKVIKGLEGIGNTAKGIGAAGLFGVSALTNNLSDAATNAFNPNK